MESLCYRSHLANCGYIFIIIISLIVTIGLWVYCCIQCFRVRLFAIRNSNTEGGIEILQEKNDKIDDDSFSKTENETEGFQFPPSCMDDGDTCEMKHTLQLSSVSSAFVSLTGSASPADNLTSGDIRNCFSNQHQYKPVGSTSDKSLKPNPRKWTWNELTGVSILDSKLCITNENHNPVPRTENDIESYENIDRMISDLNRISSKPHLVHTSLNASPTALIDSPPQVFTSAASQYEDHMYSRNAGYSNYSSIDGHLATQPTSAATKETHQNNKETKLGVYSYEPGHSNEDGGSSEIAQSHVSDTSWHPSLLPSQLGRTSGPGYTSWANRGTVDSGAPYLADARQPSHGTESSPIASLPEGDLAVFRELALESSALVATTVAGRRERAVSMSEEESMRPPYSYGYNYHSDAQWRPQRAVPDDSSSVSDFTSTTYEDASDLRCHLGTGLTAGQAYEAVRSMGVLRGLGVHREGAAGPAIQSSGNQSFGFHRPAHSHPESNDGASHQDLIPPIIGFAGSGSENLNFLMRAGEDGQALSVGGPPSSVIDNLQSSISSMRGLLARDPDQDRSQQ